MARSEVLPAAAGRGAEEEEAAGAARRLLPGSGRS